MTTIHVTASRDYDVLVQPGLLDDAGAQIARVLGTGRTAAIVAGETVAGLYAGRLAASLTRAGFRAVTFTYPGGEHCKTLATYAALLDFLAAHRLSRSDLIVALGGGVTGDLAGFAAATYQRGPGRRARGSAASISRASCSATRTRCAPFRRRNTATAAPRSSNMPCCAASRFLTRCAQSRSAHRWSTSSQRVSA